MKAIRSVVTNLKDSEVSSQDWEDWFLNWISDLEIVMVESRRQLGGLQYFHFASQGKLGTSRLLSGFGSHQNRKIAAIKCAAELIERQTMLDFFQKQNHDISKTYQSSNGWSVHRSEDAARNNALNEAIERHLLLKSYLESGWRGFSFVDRMTADGNDLVFLISKFRNRNKIAGMVVCKSPKYPGVSFGYCLGEISSLQNPQFWQPAIFEAVDKILTLNGDSYPLNEENWIRKDIKYFLETPFASEKISKLDLYNPEKLINCEIGASKIETFNLLEKYDLEFPLFAAFARGENLIPLAPIGSLGHLTQVNEKHPIL